MTERQAIRSERTRPTVMRIDCSTVLDCVAGRETRAVKAPFNPLLLSVTMQCSRHAGQKPEQSHKIDSMNVLDAGLRKRARCRD